MRTHNLLIAAAAMALLGSTAAEARTMRVMESTPSAQTVMTGRNDQFIVRFDGPIDHHRSTIEILRDSRVIQRLRPRLNSGTNVLAASAPALQPGQYVIHWTVRSMRDGDTTDGTIPFSVAR